MQLDSPRDVASYRLPSSGDRPVKQFGIVLQDTEYLVLKTSLLTVGTLDANLVHPRDVSLETEGRGHGGDRADPSGDPTSSGEDVALIARLVEAGLLTDIEVVDHLILADGKIL